MKTTRMLFPLVFLTISFCSHADDALTHREWKVDGATREALVHVPSTAKTNATPLVFAFHGHGGTMERAAKMFGYHTEWPEAIVVYMQGLKTPGQLTDLEGKKSGWQKTMGDQADRDLKFFDIVLASLKNDYKVDAKRIYSTGHSNGGAFTYLLWAARGEQFAAFAPSASVGRFLIENDPALTREFLKADRHLLAEDAAASKQKHQFIPKPVLHVAGDNDPLVKFQWQQLMLHALRKKNDCGEGKPWQREKKCTIYESELGAPVVTFIHSEMHKFPKEAPSIIVKFFKQHAKRS